MCYPDCYVFAYRILLNLITRKLGDKAHTEHLWQKFTYYILVFLDKPQTQVQNIKVSQFLSLLMWLGKISTPKSFFFYEALQNFLQSKWCYLHSNLLGARFYNPTIFMIKLLNMTVPILDFLPPRLVYLFTPMCIYTLSFINHLPLVKFGC